MRTCSVLVRYLYGTCSVCVMLFYLMLCIIENYIHRSCLHISRSLLSLSRSLRR
ncbi:hypothetical protein EVA_21451 [gut metagenome]|uniref:Uncharacterized protein n=1 Tax=gut metagenome TaxID=749906 RepID=J9FLD7_9ZZZZ